MNRTASERETLARASGELQARHAALQKEQASLREVLAAVRAESQHAEMQLYEKSCALEAAETARRQLEKDNKQLTLRREEVQNQLNLARRDMDQEGGQLREKCDELQRRLEEARTEQARLLSSQQHQHDVEAARLTREKEEAVRALESQLQKSAHAWSREQDDLLGQKKQQAQQQLEEHRAELERLRGEASSHGQLSRSSVGALHTDISRLRTQMEDKVKVKLKVTEEHRDRLERDLTELNRKLSEVETQNADCNRSLADTKRALQEAEHELATLDGINGELRDKIKRLEAEKGELKRVLDEANQRISILDGAQESSAKQSHELRTQLRDLERQDANDTHKNDIHNLQVQMRDLEAVREGLQKQLAECRATGHRLEEDKENLEIRLSASSQEATDLKVRLVACWSTDLLDAAPAGPPPNAVDVDPEFVRQGLKDLMQQEEANKKRERETKALQERLVRLETANTKLQLEKEVLEDKLGMLRSQESQQEEERRALRHSLETVEISLCVLSVSSVA
ncbi:rootletin-like [Pollicipes pollicipes]|uniref:rootletin-like n=1 Tax=Pollicipes pollicipes TaxID=41117 RepID=UPI001884C720|nr:rootletin-like [Pollicipes pollicipes]